MTDKTIYKKVNPNPDFGALERDVIEYWNREGCFEKSVANREAKIADKNNEFIFYDGPPFANGLPHYGHLLTGFVKDSFARYQTMIGKKAERRFGWDTHGLPVEMETEKELKISGRTAITEYGIDKFNDACKESVMKYAGEWKSYVERQGRWVDFDDSYKTMDLSYMESVIWAFKQLYNKGLVYEDLRVMPYSWACQTPLSNFETKLDNSYRQKESKALTVLFELSNSSPELSKIANGKKIKLAVWTTTPWTLPSNLALALGKDIEYSIVENGDELTILATSLLRKYHKELGLTDDYIAEKTIIGQDIVGSEYKPLFSYLSSNKNYNLNNAFKVYAADFVTIDDGTGIVHIAPGFGEDDQLLCKEVGIPTICPVDDAGCFKKEIKAYAGLQVFEANVPIIKDLKISGNWLKTEQYLHNYPHCWRTDTPLIYKAMPSWYVKVTEFKDRMVELNQQINWIPEHIRDGQFGKWLENARDWSISRNRFWGCPVPIWISDDPNYPRIDVYGSLDELEQDFGTRPTNLHRPYIDELTRPNPDDPTGKSTMRRVSDVLDCWFESGSMPFAQAHYPFENKEWFEEHFPADFIVEYIAQTRGWFYTLMVLSTAIFDRPPFKNCICHGVILDENSEKLSKRLKNYTSPNIIFEKYGSDAMRWFMCSSPVMRGNELNIDKEGNVFKDTLRLALKPIWNSYNFFILYANADAVKAKYSFASNNILDRYISAKCHDVVKQVREALDDYDTITAYNAVEHFFDVLNNWYIRRNRNRFWKKERDEDKIAAYNTLYSVLRTIITTLAPLAPFISEIVFKGLAGEDSQSVHLEGFPDHTEIPFAPELVSDMDLVREICNLSHSLRSKENIRIRQPLAKLQIAGKNLGNITQYFDLIKDETNVKEIEYIADVATVADFKLVLNFAVLGKKLGKKMKEIAALANRGKWQQEANGNVKIGDEILSNDDFEIQAIAKGNTTMMTLSGGVGLIGLDMNISAELIEEGIARDIIRHVQQKRKDLSLNITDKIKISFYTQAENIKSAILAYEEYIKDQTLSLSFDFLNNSNGVEADNVEGQDIEIIINR